MRTTRVELRRSGLGNWVGVGDETLPDTPTPPVPGVVLLQRVAACCRREHQHSEVGRDLRPDLRQGWGRIVEPFGLHDLSPFSPRGGEGNTIRTTTLQVRACG